MVDASRAVILFVVVALLYAAAGVCLFRIAVRRLLRRRAATPAGEESRPKRAPSWRARVLTWGSRAVLALAALGLLCMAYARLVEPFRPQIVRVRIETDKLPAGARPVRLVLISDTHSDPSARLEPRLPEIIAKLAPDAIVFAGDALNASGGLPHFRACMRRLAETAPTFAVRGNWDVWWFPEADLFGGTGVRELDGTAARVVAGESEIWLVGAAVERAHALLPAFETVPEGRFAVLVHHYPETIDLMGGWGADLALAGDTHGGQMRLPLVGALVRISRYGRYRDIGLHRVGKAWLYINRGIGMEGGRAPRVRFRCRPEITLIEIAPKTRGR